MQTKHEVVISGMAGMFPETWDVAELKEKLMQNINLVTNEEKKWKKGEMDVPIYLGKVPEADAFDGMFFGIPSKHSDSLDQGVRKSLELAYCAVVDAGINPAEISGTNTAVLSCCCISDSEYEKSLRFGSKTGALITGLSKGMQANRVSFHLNAKGPSYTIDASWNGCFEAIKYAYDKISSGCVNAAIVTSCNLIYLPENSYHYQRMGRLNNDGRTKCFSNDADGYSRSEGCVAFFIQRKEDALRSYGTVLGVSVSNQESKTSPLEDVSPGQFLPVLKQVYETHHINPLSVAYIEAAGCASKVLDAEELNTIAELMLPGRNEPLPIGCVKSNLGHCEASSDAVSLVKALLAADSGTIAPNLHYTSPNSMVPALVSGKLKVVTEPTPLSGKIIGVNNISVIGSIKHVIVKQHDKVKQIEPKKGKLPDGIPRLFIMSGRNETDVLKILDKVETMPIDPEYIALTHRVFKNGIKNHMFRAYTIINEDGEQHRGINEFFTGHKTEQVWFVFTGMGSQWPGMGRELMKLSKFAEAIQKCQKAMEPYGIDVYKILTSEDPKLFDDLFFSFIGIAAVQIGLVDILRDIGIVPDGVIGHSVGELGCAYADGCLTAEQVILCAYSRGVASNELEAEPGLMAAVGKGYNEIKDSLPESIDVACHNSSVNCTISGPEEDMKKYIKSLKEQNVFVREVNSGNIAYHSRYIKQAGSHLLKELKKVIPQPKLRSKKWISTSVPEKDWNTDLAKYCSSEYQTKNLLSSVLFEEAAVHVPQDATIIEIAPHGLLQAILKQCFPNAYHISLTKRGNKQGLTFLCKALGRAYLRGHLLDLEKFYPPIEYPVSRGTETLSNLLTWEHSNISRPTTFLMKDYEKLFKIFSAIKQFIIDLENGFSDLKHYQLQGVPVISLGSCLELGINELLKRNGNDFHLVQLKDIKFLKYEDIKEKCALESIFQFGTGNWQITKDEEELVHGQITFLPAHKFPTAKIVKGNEEPGINLYERLDRFGLKIGPAFKLIKTLTASIEEISATLVWDGKLSHFLEAVLQVPLAAYKDSTTLLFVNKISKIIIDLEKFPVNETKEIDVHFNNKTKCVYCDGLEITNITLSPVFKRLNYNFVFQEPQFLQYESSNVQDLKNFLTLVQQIVCNNFMNGNIKREDLDILEVGDVNFHSELYNAFQNCPGLNVYLKMIPDEKNLLLEGLESKEYRPKNILIASTSLSPRSSLGILQHFRDGFILVRDQVLPSDFEVITSKKIGNHVYTLSKKAETPIVNNSFVFLTSNDWEAELKNHLNTHKDRKVCLTGYVSNISKMCYIIEKTCNFNNFHNLRYLFHDLANEKNQTKFFEPQLSKGLRINILHKNNWSLISYRAVSLTVQKLNENNTFKFSQISLNGAEVKAIGLNPIDDSGLYNKASPVEYSGTKKGENICGIGTIDEISHTINPDGILKWEKPDNWTHDEIASVLLPYSLAFSIIKSTFDREMLRILQSNKILIHRGCLPLSQALINIAESQGLEVFTSYKDNVEKELIEKLFPKIPSSNIVSCETSDFCYLLLSKMRGEGFSMIVSCLPEKEMIKANTLLTAEEGMLFQTTSEKGVDSSCIGMGYFSLSTTVKSLSPLDVIFMSNDEKKMIRDCLQNAFKSGIIKPLTMTTLKNDIDNITAVELFKNSINISDRLVLTPTGNFMKRSALSVAEENDHYVISVPSEAQGHLWLYLMEWMILRGALNIHIIINWSAQPEFIYEKFHHLKLTSPRCKINVETTEQLGTADKIRKFIVDIKQKSKLSFVFISSEERSDKLKAICEASGNARITYFTEYLDENFERISKNGLLVVDQNSLLDADILKSVIDSLVQLPKTILRLSHISLLNSSIVVDDPWKNYNQHLPWTFNEIVSCTENTNKISWKEVRTSTLRFQDCIGSSPVLIIPPIKKWQLDKLIKSLFYPAFLARIPRNIHSASELAKELFKEALAMKTSVFILLCSDWSYSIGLQLGKLLESEGRKISIVFLQPLITLDSPNLYDVVHQKIADEVKQYTLSQNNEKSLEAGFNLLKNRLDLISSDVVSNVQGNKLQGFVVLVKNKLSSDYMYSALSKNCENQIAVYNSEEKSYLEMISSKEIAAVVNSVPSFHHNDAARTVPNIFSLTRFNDNPRTEHLNRLVVGTKIVK